ncbi:MAG TPA: HAMP domain-containing sensor histidine kinase [Chloroflexota bacterium]|nr:HAMP domain-containing sensor histidine kinase [Chloroflexota bacterium]
MRSIFARTRWWLARWNLVVLALTLVLMCATMYGAFYQSFLSQMDLGLQSHAQETLRETGHDVAHFGRDGYEGGFFALVVGPGGQLIENPQQVRVASLTLSRANAPTHFETASVNGESTRLYVEPLSTGPWAGSLLVVGESLAPEQSAVYRLLLVVLVVGGGGLVAAVVAAWFLSGKALGPIQAAFQRQQEFTADASHELRTPLTVMRSATDLLSRHQDVPLRENADLVDDLRGEIGRLERITADLLTLARSDAGKMELAVGELELGGLAAEVVRRMGPLAVQRQVALQLAGSERLVVEADPDRIEQVLIILLDNALKHTPAGGQVEVSLRKQGHQAVVAVRDNGEGIASEQLERVFDRFYRADRARSHADGGTGLGLAIAKALAEAHDGQLSLRSVPGAGTTATLRLTLLPPASLAGKIARLATRRTGPPLRD